MIPAPISRFRSLRAAARTTLLAALAVTALTGCDRKARQEAERLAAELAAANASRDSLSTAMQTAGAERDRALAELVDASRFAASVDDELRQVRGLASKVKPQTADESGQAQDSAARADVLARLRTLRQRLNARTADLQRTRDSIAALQGEATVTAQLLGDLQARLATREQEIAVFETEIRNLRAANTQLTQEKVALTDTVTTLNRVYYTIGTKKELIARGVVSQEGGSRALLVVRLGRTLVPARQLENAAFVQADRRDVLSIPLPRSDKRYKFVSRHDVQLIEAEEIAKDGSFRGASIRITAPTRFWSASPYLIIVEQ